MESGQNGVRPDLFLGADPLKGEYINTPLERAIQKGYIDIVDLLLDEVLKIGKIE